MKMTHLLNDLVDIHLHVGPSLMNREIDIAEAALRASEVGYKAIVQKDHHYSTAFQAKVVKDHIIPDSKTQVFGSVCLNNTVGGVNALAAECAIKSGAKIVWMPTSSARQHYEHLKQANFFPKLGDGTKFEEEPIVITDDNGKLTNKAMEVLEMIKKYPNVILASGHVSPPEVDALVDSCVEMGIVDRLIVDHPTGILDATLDDMVRWAKKGATMEIVAEMSVGLKHTLVPIDDAVNQIRTVGYERCILSSDGGAKGNGDIIETMDRLLTALAERGFTDEELIYMSNTKPSQLLGLD